MAQELGIATEASAHQVEGVEVNPWTQEMYRAGLSFNGNERNKLFVSDGALLHDLSDVLGADVSLDGRALAAADLDQDGDADLFVHNIQRERHVLLRNDLGEPRHAVSVRLRGTRGDPEAIGAQVLAEWEGGQVVQVLARGAGYATSDAPELLFGVGDAGGARLSVLWPGRTEFEPFGRVEGGAQVLLVEGETVPRPREVEATQLAGPWPDGLKLGPGDSVPSFVLETEDGRVETFEPASLRAGEELHLHFWASYCRPCVAELPRLGADLSDGAWLVPLSLDVPADRGRAAELLARNGVSLPARFVPLADEASLEGIDQLVDLLRLPIPTTIVLGEGGRVLAVEQGAQGQRERDR